PAEGAEMTISTELVQVLNGDEGFASPLGTKAKDLALGDVLQDHEDRLAAMEGSGGEGGTSLQADTIEEETAGAGVTADSVLLKDGSVTTTASGSVTTNTIAEKTAASGVTIDGLQIKDNSVRITVIADPGNGGAIPVLSSGSCAITTAGGGETRTL